jgi:hypothetical protein
VSAKIVPHLLTNKEHRYFQSQQASGNMEPWEPMLQVFTYRLNKFRRYKVIQHLEHTTFSFLFFLRSHSSMHFPAQAYTVNKTHQSTLCKQNRSNAAYRVLGMDGRPRQIVLQRPKSVLHRWLCNCMLKYLPNIIP